jgi:hypothetical protein
LDGMSGHPYLERLAQVQDAVLANEESRARVIHFFVWWVAILATHCTKNSTAPGRALW